MTDPTPNDLPGPTPLSPATQAVLDAYFTHADLLNREVSHEEMLAAALRALADQVLEDWNEDWNDEDWNEETYDKILAIATELENQ